MPTWVPFAFSANETPFDLDMCTVHPVLPKSNVHNWEVGIWDDSEDSRVYLPGLLRFMPHQSDCLCLVVHKAQEPASFECCE